MNPGANPSHRPSVGSAVTPVLRAVLLADLVDSTGFVQRFGDARAAVALQRLDLQIRDLLEFTGGRLIDKADGLLALFERPVQAVDFALRYQQTLRHFSSSEGVQLTARVGIHVGELMTWSNSSDAIAAGAKPLEVEGLAKPVASRLMTLALPGQILISSMAMTLAQRAQAELGERAQRVRWIAHGRYRFKGVPAPMIVHEVGETGFAPLRTPTSSQKSWRDVPIWRRPPVLAIELLLFLGVAGFYAYGVLRSPPALAFNERDWVVVGDISNFTGDPRLEDSLETALRISLEQSRFVNVVPRLKMQGVLQRMGREQQSTVDRAVGSEIALREGARALLLPSIAEVGGHLRVSIEVVDPSNQVTVFAESAEGRGAESALTSLDAVNGQLRERLGESLGDIKANGKPLAQITTPSLDALRFYTLANEASIRHYRFDESLRLLNLALREDPAFAMAYSARARLHLADSDYPGAKADFELAKRHRSRLSTREALTLDTGLAEFGPAQERVDIWKLFARIYPDTYRAYFQVAFNQAFYLQLYDQALLELKPALSSQNPRFSGALHLSGLLNLAQERYPEARVAFERGESLGGRDPIRYHADTHAAQRQFEQAQRLLGTQAKTGFPGADMDARLPEITYPLDRGEWEQALSAARTLEQAAPGARLQSRTYGGTLLGLRSYEEGRAVLPDLQRYVGTELKRALVPDDPEVVSSSFAALYGAAMAARLGDTRTATHVLDSLRKVVPGLGYPALDDMVAVVQAELALAEQQPENVAALLRPRLSGGELNVVHSTLLRAYRQDRAFSEARHEAEWLIAHRGRAYVEWNSQYLLQPINVLESNLALLAAAEIARDTGDAALSARMLDQFGTAWKTPPGFVAGRVQSLRLWLSQNKHQTDRKSPRSRPAGR